MNRKYMMVAMGVVFCACMGFAMYADADTGTKISGALNISGVATKVKGNLGAVAKLITALSYVAGMAFAIGAVAKFKAHKDNPTQIPIGTPIALLFIGAALIFIPSVFSTTGGTLFGGSGVVAGVSGITSFT